MKTFVTIICVFIAGMVMSQSLVIKGYVYLQHKQLSDNFQVKILNLNTNECKVIEGSKFFTESLAYNSEYVIVVIKEGFQPKSIYINTNCNIDKQTKYLFDVTLLESEDDNPIQVGGIFFNKKKEIFDYYLTNN